MRNYTKFRYVGVVLAALWLMPAGQAAMAADPPLKLYGKATPSDVYRLAVSISKFARHLAGTSSNKERRSAALALRPEKFSGLKPSDAVKAVFATQKRVNALRKQRNLKPVKTYRRADGKVTPAIVFINAGTTLDGLYEVARRSDPKSALGDLYDVKKFKGKSPSDVYGMMNYSARVLGALMGQSQAAAGATSTPKS